MHRNLNLQAAGESDSGINIVAPNIKATEQALGAYITFIQCGANQVFVGLGNASLYLHKHSEVARSDKARRMATDGLPLCAGVCPISNNLLLGTDTGAVIEVTSFAAESLLRSRAQLAKGWVEHLAISPQGLVAFSNHSHCYLLSGTSEAPLPYQIPLPHTSINALQFNRTGQTLALAHTGGVSFWCTRKAKLLNTLKHNAAHLNLSWSPDARYLVTATPEKAIHGWDMCQQQSFCMQGYAEKIRSMCWSADGKHLAIAGADSTTVWPFIDGPPNGQAPYEFGFAVDSVVTQVAAHPTQPLIAAGYSNGAVLLGSYLQGEALIARVASHDAISALCWSQNGMFLYAGTESGQFCQLQYC